MKVGSRVLSHSALANGQTGEVIAVYNSGALLRVRLDSGDVIEGNSSRFSEI